MLCLKPPRLESLKSRDIREKPASPFRIPLHRSGHIGPGARAARRPIARHKEAAMTELNTRVGEVTARIADRSRASRRAYLDRIEAAAAKAPTRKRARLRQSRPRLRRLRRRTTRRRCATATARTSAIVTAYNDMLSAHQPYRPLSRPHQAGGARGRAARPRSRAASRRCATASPRARRAWSCRCSRAT